MPELTQITDVHDDTIGKRAVDFILREWGIDQGKLLGIQDDGVTVHSYGGTGHWMGLTFVADITDEQLARLYDILAGRDDGAPR